MKEKLEFLLKNKGITATSLARLLDIQPSGISHILSGRNNPSFDLVVKILKAFPELNPDWLLLDSDVIFRADSPAVAAPVQNPEVVSPISPVLPFDVVKNEEFSETQNLDKNDLSPIFASPKNGKKIDRIIVLYSDRTFESFTEL
jgi:transcriptional regulator with XRE-family HTH domain